MAATQQNTPGFGTEYEIFVPAFFALKLNNNENVKDFSMRSNVAKEFGNLDDVIIDIEMMNNTKQCFAIQLKHIDSKSKELVPGNFGGKEGAFSLEKYCKSFKKMCDTNKEQYHFMLYTNCKLNYQSKNELKNFAVIQDEDRPGRSLFDTSCDSGNICRFEVIENAQFTQQATKEDYEEFLPKLTVFVAQKNFEDFEDDISGILKNRNAVLKYLHLFRKWHQDAFTRDGITHHKTIDRKTINIHLVDIFLSDFVITDRQLQIKQNENFELFEKLTRKFDVTVIDDSKENLTVDSVNCGNSEKFLSDRVRYLLGQYTNESLHQKFNDDPEGAMFECMLYLGKKYKLVDKATQQLDERSKKKVLYYFFEHLFFIDVNKSSKGLVYHMFDLYKANENIKFVLVGEGIDSSKFPKFTIFENLNDLRNFDHSSYLEVITKCQLSLQGKDRITLELLINSCGQSDFISVKAILLMLQDDFVVGEEREILPVNYIHRKVSTFVVNSDTVFNPTFVRYNTVIINFCGQFEQIRHKFEEQDIRVISINNFSILQTPSGNPTVISTTNELLMASLPERIFAGSFVHLQMIDADTFVPTFFKIDDRKVFNKIIVGEEEVHHFFNNRINILSAQPGMGKSTMFKVLKNQMSQWWTVLIDLKAHNMFLKTKRPIQEVLTYFMEESRDGFLEKIKTAFLDAKKIVFFFDGLDELDTTCIDNVLDYCEDISNLGLHVWISSRQNLQHQLTSRFSKDVIDIVEISKDDQKQYIKARLCNDYNDEEIQQLTTKLFSSSEMVNNRQVLGIPLQLFIITQSFLDDRDQFDDMIKNIFILTKMYQIYFNGRYKHTTDKQESKNPHLAIGEPEDYFEKYEILALQSLFDDDVFAELSLDTRRSKRFLQDIKKKKDPLGIVVKVNSENKAVFDHFTYGEYFACAFLANNFDKVRVLKEQIFSDRHKNLLLLLNVKLAEDNPLHLAVIYRDIIKIETYRNDQHLYDKGGRNPLHIAVSNGSKYPGCLTLKDYQWSFTTSRFLSMAELMIQDMLIIKSLNRFDLLQREDLFNWNCLDYAFASGCLFAAEVILPKFEISNKVKAYLERYQHDPPFASFCTLTGTVNLLSLTLAENLIPTMTSWLQESLLEDTITFCVFKKFDMLRFLLDNGVNVDYKMKTSLQLAVQKKILKLVKLLLDRGAPTDVTTKDGDTLLHCAVQTEPFTSINALNGKISALGLGTTSSDQCRDIFLVTELLKTNIPIDSRNNMGETALHLAVARGDHQVVQLLYQRGADINAVTKNNSNVLHYAWNIFNNELAAFLINNTNVDINAQNNDGIAPLLGAVKNGNLRLVRLLLDRGAQINVPDNDGITPLEWAERENLVYIAEEIIRKAEDVRKANGT